MTLSKHHTQPNWQPTCNKLLLLLFTFLVTILKAQENYQYSIYTQENGLASGTIRGIKKDQTGFIWLLSENGLTRFDGYTFKKFPHIPSDSTSISSIDVKNVYTNESEELLFLTANGFNKYVPSISGFKKIISFVNSDEYRGALGVSDGFWIVKQNGLLHIDKDNSLSTIYHFPSTFSVKGMNLVSESDGKIWVADKNTLLCFDTRKGTFSKIAVETLPNGKNEFNEKISCLISIKGKTTYFYSYSGLFKYDESRHVFVQISKRKLEFEKENPIDGIYNSNEYLLFSLRYDQLWSIHLESGEERIIHLVKPNENPSPKAQISSLNKINDSTLWVSSATRGLFKVYLKSGKVHALSNDPNYRFSLPSNNIDIVLNDGNVMWLVSPGLGLIKGEYLNPLFQTYRPFERNFLENFTLSNNIRTIAELDRNNLLIGGLDGLLKFNKGTKQFSLFYPEKGKEALLHKSAISKIIKDTLGNIWISIWGRDGVYVVSKEGKKVRIVNPADPSMPNEYKSIRSMLIDSRGTLWLGTDNNLIFTADVRNFSFESKTPVKFTKILGGATNDDLHFNICFAFNENSKGQILIGTQNGFYIYDSFQKKFKRYSNEANNPSSISANDVRSIFIDKQGLVWLATNGGGINSFDESTGIFHSYTTLNGLTDNSTYSILEDEQGVLWIGTNKGLCAFNKSKKTFRNYLLKDGIQNYEFNTNSALKTSDGELVFGGINGFNIFNPSALELKSTSPKVVLTEFKISDVDRAFDDQEIKLAHNQNYVSFQFAALNYYRNAENNYAYKLEGINKDWIYCGDRRFTNYANLSPGTYTFRVKASNSFGVWSEDDAVLKFSIATPWYKTWLFYSILLIAISGIIYFIYHYRLQQAIQLQSVRNSIARDLHDEIGSNLSSISLFTEVAKDKNKSAENNVSAMLQKISEYTQTSQEAMNDIVWMINTRNDRFENIIVRMRSLAVELLEAKNINLHLSFDERLNQLKMGMNERKNFYLIYKEALNNIVKYAQSGNVWIDLKLTQNLVHLNIKDDGMGFDQSSTSSGNGLINMKKRTQVLNGQINLQSKIGAGTTLDLTFEL